MNEIDIKVKKGTMRNRIYINKAFKDLWGVQNHQEYYEFRHNGRLYITFSPKMAWDLEQKFWVSIKTRKLSGSYMWTPFTKMEVINTKTKTFRLYDHYMRHTIENIDPIDDAPETILSE